MGEWKETKIGTIPTEWDTKPFEEIIEKGSLSYGVVQPGTHQENNSVPILRVNNIRNGRIIPDDVMKIDKGIEARYRRTRLKGGELLLTVVGSVGEAVIVPDEFKDWNVARAVSVSRISEDYDKNFVRYCFSTEQIKHQMYSHTNDTVQPTLNLSSLKEIIFPIPQLPEQQAIAGVLSSLDDKIDLLRHQNKTLEALAETLFRQWYVEEAEESWERKSLDQIAHYLNGLALQKYPVNDGESLPVIKIRELNQGITDTTDKCSRAIPEQYIIHDGDILFSWSGSLQIVIWHDGEGALNQHLFKVTSEYYPKWFYYFATKYHLEDFRAIAESKSTTMGHIQRYHLSEAFISIPPEDLFKEYDNSISPLIEKLIKNNAQIKILTRQRDTLLPKLMSGEVRVKL